MRLLTLLLICATLVVGCDVFGEGDSQEQSGKLLAELNDWDDVLGWTERGDEILLRRRRDRGIDVVNPETGDVHTLVRLFEYGGEPHRLGRQVAVARGSLFLLSWRFSEGRSRHALDHLEVATGQVTRLLEMGSDGILNDIAASPDGAFVLYPRQRPAPSLFRLDVATGVETEVVSLPRDLDKRHPFYSPQADRLVFFTDDGTDGAKAHLVDVETQTVRTVAYGGRVLDVLWREGDPYLVADRFVPFGDVRLYVQSLDGGTSSEISVTLPFTNPKYGKASNLKGRLVVDLEEQRLLYPRSHVDRLYLIERDLLTGEEQVLTSHAYGASAFGGVGVRYMSLSADGRQLVYQIYDRLYSVALGK